MMTAMGRDNDQPTPDLFSADTARELSTVSTKLSATEPATDKSLQRHVLPKNLRHAIEQLNDGELDELFAVAFDEAKRRGRLPSTLARNSAPLSQRSSESVRRRSSGDKASHQRKMEIPEVSLTQGQVNAVRAAFKAGITPSRIARQFGISHSNVRKALAD
jgi:hypothetical protein